MAPSDKRECPKRQPHCSTDGSPLFSFDEGYGTSTSIRSVNPFTIQVTDRQSCFLADRKRWEPAQMRSAGVEAAACWLPSISVKPPSRISRVAARSGIVVPPYLSSSGRGRPKPPPAIASHHSAGGFAPAQRGGSWVGNAASKIPPNTPLICAYPITQRVQRRDAGGVQGRSPAGV